MDSVLDAVDTVQSAVLGDESDDDSTSDSSSDSSSDTEEKEMDLLNEAREITSNMESEVMERGLNMDNENVSLAESKMSSMDSVDENEYIPSYSVPEERDNIDTISGLTTNDVANYIHSHQLLHGRYVDASGKVEVATHRMFKLKSNFSKFDVLFDCVLKSESETVAETEMERELIKSAFVSKSVRKFIGVSIFGFSFGKTKSSRSTKSSYKQSKNELYNLSVISSSDFIRGKFVLTKKCVDFTDEFIKDKNELFEKEYTNEKEKEKAFDEFNRKYGDFYITQALIGGKLFVENETTMHSKQEYKMSKKNKGKAKSSNYGFDGTMLGTLIGTAVGAKYGDATMGAELGQIVGDSIEMQMGSSSAKARGNMASSFNNSSNSAISRSLQCIGGDPSQATYLHVNEWENSLWNHKRWEVIDVKSVKSWHDWLDLEAYEESYIPSTNRNSVIDDEINDTIFENRECSITISQHGDKFGYLCNQKENLVIRNVMLGDKFKFVEASFNEFYRIYVSDDSQIEKSKFIQVVKPWLNVNEKGLLVTEYGSVAKAGLFRMNKIGKCEYSVQFVKLKGKRKGKKNQEEKDDSGNSISDNYKMDMEYIGIDSNYKGDSNPKLSCIDNGLFSQDLSVVFELNYTDDELKFDQHVTHSFESSKSKQKYLSNNFSFDKYGVPTLGFLSENDSKFQLNSVEVASNNGQSIKNLFEIIEVYDSKSKNYLAIQSQDKPKVCFLNEKNDKSLLKNKENRKNYCYWRIVELRIGGVYKIQHFGSETWLAYNTNSGNKYKLIGKKNNSNKSVIKFLIQPNGDNGDNDNNVNNNKFPGPRMKMTSKRKNIKVIPKAFSRSMTPVKFCWRYLNSKSNGVKEFNYSFENNNRFRISSSSLKKEKIEAWFIVEVDGETKENDEFESGKTKMTIEAAGKTFDAPLFEQENPSNAKNSLYRKIYFKIKLSDDLLKYNEKELNLLRDCKLVVKILNKPKREISENLSDGVLKNKNSNDAKKVERWFDGYSFQIDGLKESTKYKLKGALYTRDGNQRVTEEFEATAETASEPSKVPKKKPYAFKVSESNYHGRNNENGKWRPRGNDTRIEKIAIWLGKGCITRMAIGYKSKDLKDLKDKPDKIIKISKDEVICKVTTWQESGVICGIQFGVKNVNTGEKRTPPVCGFRDKDKKRKSSKGGKLVSIYQARDKVKVDHLGSLSKVPVIGIAGFGIAATATAVSSLIKVDAIVSLRFRWVKKTKV